MSRIPFRIYRISNPEVPAPEGDTGYSIGAWRYLVGITEENIYHDRREDDPENVVGYLLATVLTPANFPDPGSIEPLDIGAGKPVYSNDPKYPGSLYIQVKGNLYFIRRSHEETSTKVTNPRPVKQPTADVFEFYVNPQRISFNHQKIISEVRTRGGWDIQHWGEKLTEITVEGITGGLHRDGKKDPKPGDYGQSLNPTQNINESPAWAKLRTLRQWYDEDHMSGSTNQLCFSVFDDSYTGYFQSFNGPEISAEKPYLITFSFTFKVEKKQSYNTIVTAGTTVQAAGG